MRFAPFLLGLIPLASATREGATPDPLVLYEFLPADCVAEIFPAAAASTLENPPQLMRESPELSSCVAGGVGIESTDDSTHIGPRLRSDIDMTGIYGALDKTGGVGAGLTLEFWIQPAEITTGDLDEPIFTLNGPEYLESWAGDRCLDRGGYVCWRRYVRAELTPFAMATGTSISASSSCRTTSSSSSTRERA
jgi:hypothetical protein